MATDTEPQTGGRATPRDGAGRRTPVLAWIGVAGGFIFGISGIAIFIEVVSKARHDAWYNEAGYLLWMIPGTVALWSVIRWRREKTKRPLGALLVFWFGVIGISLYGLAVLLLWLACRNGCSL